MTAARDSHGLGAQAERLGTRGAATSGTPLDGALFSRIVGVYAGVGVAAAGVSFALSRDPFTCDSQLGARGAASWLISSGLGLLIGAATVGATRVMVRRTLWAQALSHALRPAVSGTDGMTILAVAVASSTGEELLFRGLLVPLVGVVVSSLFFGVLHQIRGRGRWGWMVWATLMGILFGSVFLLTGSLAGPLIAHAAINYANLRYLRDTAPAPRPRALGGLLQR